MRSLRPTLSILALGAAILSGTGPLPAPAVASAEGSTLVISEVYGAGGNPGAAFNADFVELYNPTGHTLALEGLSVHFRSATGRFSVQPFALHGSLPAHRHFLIRMSGVHSTGARLPTPDAIADPRIGMAARGGQVFLLNGTRPVAGSGDMVGNARVVDMVGLGSAKSFETAPGPNTSAVRSANRSAAGADSDDNSADFTLATPSPRNLASDDAPRVTAGLDRARVGVRTGTTSLRVHVAGTPAPTGAVDIYVGGRRVTTVPLGPGGDAVATVGPVERAGPVRVVASYTGDATYAGSDADAVTLTVVKAAATLVPTHSPRTIRVGHTRPTLTVGLSARGVVVRGRVRFESGGRQWVRTISHGRASVRLPVFHRTGPHPVLVTYLGSGLVSRATTTTRLRVVR